MENIKKTIDIRRTEEIQDIIERMPQNSGRIVLWIVFSLTMLLLILGWYIKYPQVVPGPITISAQVSPVKLVSKTSGKLVILKKRDQIVKHGEIFAFIESSAHLHDILQIDSTLKEFNPEKKMSKDILATFPRNVNLGEMTEIYFRFLNALELVVQFPATDSYQFRNEENKLAIKSQVDILKHLDSLSLLKSKSKAIINNLFVKDSLQYYQIKGIAETDFDKTKLEYYSSLENSLSLKKDLSNTDNQIKSLYNKQNQLSLDQQSYLQKTNIDLVSSYSSLKYGLEQWILNYTFRAPLSGKLEFLDFWKQNDFIESGVELFSILPEKNFLIGNVYLPISGAGKVKVGQHVNIKLDNFPYNEYGIIDGSVMNVSLLAGKRLSLGGNQVTNAYLVTVKLPKGLTTNYGTNLGFQYEIKGIAEIITDKRRLIERLFDNLKYIAKTK